MDAVLFTGPWGTALPALRTRICRELTSLGLKLDPQLNLSPYSDVREVNDVSQAYATGHILIVPTDQRPMIASAGAEAMELGQVCPAILAKPRRVPIGISVRHVHPSREHVDMLYGSGHKLVFEAPLSQPGQFSCEEMADIVGPKGRIERVRVLGPERPSTQVEISSTECLELGIQAPVRMSGDLADTPGLRIEHLALSSPADLARG